MGFDRTPDRVLIVHDPSTAGPSKLPLAIPGAEVVEARSFSRYQEELSKSDFDVVVIDYDLPGTQRPEVLAELKVRDNEPDVLLLSTCTDTDTIRRISRSQKRYVVRDELWVESIGRAVRDMLRIRKLEAENAQIRARLTESNRQLEERNERLDEFCATIAHDIRGPLAGLILKIDYILERFREGLDPKCVEMLGRSMDSAHRLVGVVQSMYEFAKLGRDGTEFSSVELAPMAREVVADLRGSAKCQVTLEAATLPAVRGNPDLLRRVFINLFGNSIKYGEREWVIVSVTSPGTVSRGDTTLLELRVRDNGPGIDPKQAKGVFDMFARGSHGAGGPEGLGVGLAVVQRILELHGGSIELIQAGQPGCCFRLLLPLA